MAIGLILYERSVIRRTGSFAISADQTHYLGDLVTNIGVVIAILLAAVLGWEWADPVIALFVAAVLVGSAWLVFRKCLDQLMDHELPDSDREKIIAIVRAHPQVRSPHDLSDLAPPGSLPSSRSISNSIPTCRSRKRMK